jgi:hypothetical protein
VQHEYLRKQVEGRRLSAPKTPKTVHTELIGKENSAVREVMLCAHEMPRSSPAAFVPALSRCCRMRGVDCQKEIKRSPVQLFETNVQFVSHMRIRSKRALAFSSGSRNHQLVTVSAV